MYQIPLDSMHRGECNYSNWQDIIGLYPLWGPIEEDSGVRCSLTESRTEIMLKLLLFVLVSLQSQIFASRDYRKFQLKTLSQYRSMSQTKAQCLAFIFNNKKIKKIARV